MQALIKTLIQKSFYYLLVGEPTIAPLDDRAGERSGRVGAAGRGAVLVDAVLRGRGLHQDHGLPAPRQQRHLAHTYAPGEYHTHTLTHTR